MQKLEPYLREIGAENVKDLREVYSDLTYLTKIRDIVGDDADYFARFILASRHTDLLKNNHVSLVPVGNGVRIVNYDTQYIWSEMESQVVLRYSRGGTIPIKDLVAAPDDFRSGTTTCVSNKVVIGSHAIAVGSRRVVSKMFIAAIGSQVTAIECISKEFICMSSDDLTEQLYRDDMARYWAAASFAAEFNAKLPAGTPRISFISCSVCQMVKKKGKPWFLCEDRVEGAWETFNTSDGVANANPTTGGTDHSIVQSFSHWTHEVSGGALLVVNCQGVFNRVSNTFELSSPVVHCTNPTRFGRTNRGREGISSFLRQHKCSDLCRIGVASVSSSPPEAGRALPAFVSA